MGAFVILFCLCLFLVLMVKVVNRRLPDPKDMILGSGGNEVKRGPRGGRYTDEKTKDGRPYRRYF